MIRRRGAWLVVALLLAGCTTVKPCRIHNGPDRGGWMVDDEVTFGIQETCQGSDYRFILRRLVARDAQGRVTDWEELADLVVRMNRGEQLMNGFTCGSTPDTRGDVIAVTRGDSLRPLRAWRIDTATRQFIVVPPESVTCEWDE